MDVKEFAQKFLKAWWEALVVNRDNATLEGFRAFFDHRFIYHTFRGDASLQEYMQHVVDTRKNAQVVQLDLKYITGEGSLYAVRLIGHFRFTTEMPGPDSGKEMTCDILCLFRHENGKVMEGWSNGTVTYL